MKKILIISDSKIGHNFVQRAIDTFAKDNLYYVIQTKADEFENAPASRFKFFEFDPTSLYKLSNVLKMEFVQVFIAMKNPADIEHTIANIRVSKKQLRIITIDHWAMDLKEYNVVQINTTEILASHMFDYLPNVPVVAQNVGLGEGEIMDVLVPFGSSFVYRHVGVIEQKQWRIVGIYRGGKLILPDDRKMIHPNDQLLLVGEPSVLNSVYRAIKREIGQFPQPFGTNLYLFVDMIKDDVKEITYLVDKAIAVHENFSNRLIIKVCNPSDLALLEKIKSRRSENIVVDIDYQQSYIEDVVLNDVKQYDVGLIMVSSYLFAKDKMREILFDANVPVLSLAERSIEKIKDAVIVLNDNKDLEKISTTIFDFSSQMGYNIELLKNEEEESSEQDEIIEHYQNLSAIFSKNIHVNFHHDNPIRKLSKRKNFLQCIPFTEKILQGKSSTIFSTDIEELYHRLNRYHQLFFPIKI
ncbi:MAG: TrkA C-terminal domain-containing protein [Sulfurimonadaceae bacterium]